MTLHPHEPHVLLTLPTSMTLGTYQHAVKHEAPDYDKFRPYFGWVNVDTVQKTMEQSTQWESPHQIHSL